MHHPFQFAGVRFQPLYIFENLRGIKAILNVTENFQQTRKMRPQFAQFRSYLLLLLLSHSII